MRQGGKAGISYVIQIIHRDRFAVTRIIFNYMAKYIRFNLKGDFKVFWLAIKKERRRRNQSPLLPPRSSHCACKTEQRSTLSTTYQIVELYPSMMDVRAFEAPAPLAE